MLLFNETYLYSNVDKKKRMLEARIKQSRGSVLYFEVLHVQIFIQQNILGGLKF